MRFASVSASEDLLWSLLTYWNVLFTNSSCIRGLFCIVPIEILVNSKKSIAIPEPHVHTPHIALVSGTCGDSHLINKRGKDDELLIEAINISTRS